MLKERIYNGRIIKLEDVPQYMYKLRPNCKDILRAYVRKLSDKVRYSKENPDKITKWKRETYKRNSKKICKQTMEYYLKHKEYLDIKKKEYCKINKDKIAAHRKAYRKANMKQEREYQKQYNLKHPEKKIIQQMIHDSFNYAGIRKFDTTTNMGFDKKGIKHHLLKHAKSLGFKGIKDIKATKLYHVDHIIPKASYNLKDHKEMLKCNNPLNLRWLLKEDNQSKGCRLRLDDIIIIKTLPKEIYPKSWKGIIPKESYGKSSKCNETISRI